MRFGTHFGPVFGGQMAPPGLKKPLKFIELSVKLKVSLFSARVACGTRFGTLPGSVFRACWPSRWVKPLLGFFLERPRAVQELFFGSIAVQERSKRPPKPHQEASMRPRRSKKGPRGVWGPILTPLGPLRTSKSTDWDIKSNTFKEPRGLARSTLQDIQEHSTIF